MATDTERRMCVRECVHTRSLFLLQNQNLAHSSANTHNSPIVIAKAKYLQFTSEPNPCSCTRLYHTHLPNIYFFYASNKGSTASIVCIRIPNKCKHKAHAFRLIPTGTVKRHVYKYFNA